MPRMRSRGEDCPDCHRRRYVEVNLDDRLVTKVEMPTACIRDVIKCIEDVRDKCFLEPFADGKVRLR